MITRNTISTLAVLILLYSLSILGNSCAQIGSPTGGARDSLPPVLLHANPANKTTLFKEKNIVLTFDEYIELKDIEQNVLVSPTPKIVPNINYKLKQVTIRLRDTLIPNTTYSIQFGNAIQDINENNPYPNFTYLFSTGDYIDSLTFSGNVMLAETGKIDSTLLVFLYDDLADSAVFKSKPKYVTRLDSAGNFRFKNLAPGTYHVFALKDESGQRMYTNPKALFAFTNDAIEINSATPPINLLAYSEEKEAKKTSGTGKKNKSDVLKYTASVASSQQDLLSPLSLTFSTPIRSFDSTKIHLTDTLFQPKNIQVFYSDTTQQKININTDWKENTVYKLAIDKNFVMDTLGNSLEKNDTLTFYTKRERDYASIKINFKNLEKFKQPVLQFVSNNEIVFSYPLNSATFFQKLFHPGDYTIQILDDTNQNGIWDAGNYILKRQPERVYRVAQTLSLKANWDNERDIIL